MAIWGLWAGGALGAGGPKADAEKPFVLEYTDSPDTARLHFRVPVTQGIVELLKDTPGIDQVFYPTRYSVTFVKGRRWEWPEIAKNIQTAWDSRRKD